MGKALVDLTDTAYLKVSVARRCPRRSQGRCLGIGGALPWQRCDWVGPAKLSRVGFVRKGAPLMGRSLQGMLLQYTQNIGSVSSSCGVI